MSDDDKPTAERFEDDIHAVVDRYRSACLLTTAETVGVLHVVAASVTRMQQDAAIRRAMDDAADE